ncbi:hypothetical protein [Haliangium sp.]|uniref:hypothetical protein n=1 Tax=Haliangium sp. TaxID=2663208 RepID=UPI003D1080CA
MPNDSDDNRLPTPSQLLFDVLTHIEHLQRALASTEAMTHGAEDSLDGMPYIPWPEQPAASTRPDTSDLGRAPRQPSPEAPRPTRARAVSAEQRLDIGRLHTYVHAAATSMRDLMAECDQVISYTRARIDEVRGMSLVPAGGAPVPPAAAPAASRADDHSGDDVTAGCMGECVREAQARRQPLDRSKVERAARAATRLCKPPKHNPVASHQPSASNGTIPGGLHRPTAPGDGRLGIGGHLQHECATIMARYLIDVQRTARAARQRAVRARSSS